MSYLNVEREQKRKTWAMHPIFHSDSKIGGEMALDLKNVSFVSERMIRLRAIAKCALLHLNSYLSLDNKQKYLKEKQALPHNLWHLFIFLWTSSI